MCPKFARVIGTTWIPAMMASRELGDALHRMTRGNPSQVSRLDRRAIFDAFSRLRVSTGEPKPKAPVWKVSAPLPGPERLT